MNRSIDKDFDISYQRLKLHDTCIDMLYRFKELAAIDYYPKTEIEEIIKCLTQLKSELCT